VKCRELHLVRLQPTRSRRSEILVTRTLALTTGARRRRESRGNRSSAYWDKTGFDGTQQRRVGGGVPTRRSTFALRAPGRSRGPNAVDRAPSKAEANVIRTTSSAALAFARRARK
jgi:hypothetical protein